MHNYRLLSTAFANGNKSFSQELQKTEAVRVYTIIYLQEKHLIRGTLDDLI